MLTKWTRRFCWRQPLAASGSTGMETLISVRKAESQPAGPRRYVYSGVGIIKPDLFEYVSEDVFKLAPFFFNAAKQGRLFGVAAQGLWLHVGTVAAIAEAEKALLAA